jgi:hypothetical protein
MNPSDSVKNIVSIILDISTKDIIFLTHHLCHELSFRQVEESEGLGVRTINKLTGKKSVNLELLIRLYKKQQRDLRDKLETDSVERYLPTELENEFSKDSVIEYESKYELYSECLENRLTKPEVRKQKNIKPVYKNLRLKSQKRLDKERRAKRKPAAYLF